MSVTKGQIIEFTSRGKFKVGNMLGSGAFGDVFVVNKMAHHGWEGFVTPEAFALKVIECNYEGAVVMAVKEAQTLMKIKHENIVQLIHPLKKEGRHSTFVYLLTEYCSGGNLNDRLRQNTDPSTKLNWLHQLTSAITHLHSRRPMIVHRDLKPANVLLTANDDIKVADFGLARQYEALKQLGSSASLESYYMNSGVGTKAYLAPEILTNHYTEKADIFSLGVIFYAILEGYYLKLSHGSRLYGAFVNPNHQSTPLGIAMYYSGNSKPREELDFQSTYEEHDKDVAKWLKAVVRKCFSYRSGTRPKAREICEVLERVLKYADSSESDHNSGSEDESEEESEEESDHSSGSEEESEEESDHNSGSEDESEEESDHSSGSEDESDEN